LHEQRLLWPEIALLSGARRRRPDWVILWVFRKAAARLLACKAIIEAALSSESFAVNCIGKYVEMRQGPEV
jgi:hypothetical protein